jgi:hypothetical protein
MADAFGSVDEFLAAQTDAVRAQVNALREIILGIDPALAEHVKWNSPSFVFAGDDRITLHARGSAPVRVVLHQGATTAEDTTAPATFDGDPDALLTWHSNIRASLTVTDLDDIAQKRVQIEHLLRSWLRGF